MAAALEFKQFSDAQVISSLEQAVHASRRPLRQDTLYTLQKRIFSINRCIDRHAALELVSRLGSLDTGIIGQMYMYRNRPEMAIQSGILAEFGSHTAKQLLDQDIPLPVVDEIKNGYTPSSEIWHLLVNKLIEQELYHEAKFIWAYKPPVGVSNWIVRKLCMLAAAHQDLEFIAELEPLIPKKRDSILAAHIINVLDPQTLLNLRHEISSLTPALPVEALIPQLHIEDHSIFNSILASAFSQHTSLFVFALYRYMKSLGFEPDNATVQILANACFRLGNSKPLAYAIWREHFVEGSLTPTRKVAETLLQSQLQGVGCRSSMYFLHQMYVRNIYLRNHIHFRLLGAFGSDSTYKQMYENVGAKIGEWAKWDPQLAAKEAGKYSSQAERNVETYTRPAGLADLERMLQFEKTRAAAHS